MSCVVSIVRRGIDVFITGCDVLISNGARLDGLITTGDAMRLCLWRTEDFKDMLHFVMCDHWTGLIRLDIPWGEDNRPVRATRAAVDTGLIRAGGGGSDVGTARFEAMIGWTYARWTAVRLGRTSGSSI